ncbi:hypothetical protein MNBD_DELTA01-1636 [hydrothermal vent metagenome]|uniref:Uncharacterized protein n=1 Tax=hydrothermal vent metagenome TaxID=652676 RepID=A0A3B0QPR5_9ZZZZ
MQSVDEHKTGVMGEGAEAESARVSFTPEQQGRVQTLIDDAYRKAYSKAARGAGAGEELAGLKKELESLKEDRKSSAVLRAVAKRNVVDAQEVTELIGRHVRMDDSGRLSVSSDAADGVPVGLEEYVDQWLAERPHHRRAQGSQGAGSRGARFSGGHTRYNLTDPQSWRTMPREQLDKYLKDGVNVQGAGGQVFRFRDVQNPFVEARKRKFNSGGK